MKSIYHGACLCLLLLGSLPICAGAQSGSDEAGFLLTGVVETGGASTYGLVVVLSSHASLDRRADVDLGGEFRFFGVPSGEYELYVTSVGDVVLHREYLSLHSQADHVSIRLPATNLGVNRGSTATVSRAKLLHSVPSNARKEFDKGMKAAKAKHSAEAIGHLSKAIELDPGFVDAYNNLGAQHIYANANDTARSYFQRAIELDPGAPEAHVNLALALLRLERYPEAESVARVAVRLAGNDPVPHYYLGIALLKQNTKRSEALDALQRVCDRIPHARVATALISARTGDMERAKNELRAYLKEGAPEFRQMAEQWLAILQEPARGKQRGMTDQVR